MKRLNLRVVFAIVMLVTMSLFLFTGSQAALASNGARLDDGIPPIGEPSSTSTDCNTITEISKAECEALVALYDSTNGGSWTNRTNWKTNNTPCDSSLGWFGVTCDASVPKKITRIALNNNGLTGTLPTQLGSLVNVNYFNLASNSIGGELRSEFGSMSDLVYLHLENNDLTGSIPGPFFALSNLYTLNLAGNELIGPIPSLFGNMTGLSQLVLYYNHFSGSIPPELGGMTNMSQLILYGNDLTGAIPSQLGSLTNLSFLMLNDNQLDGNIPPELGSLSHLVYLHLYNNQLTGNIPPELGNLADLQQLYLHTNNLENGIPTKLGSLTKLKYLVLNDNDLSGSIPVELGNLTGLKTLNLAHNHLNGALPKQLGNLSSLGGLYLDNNQLTGGVPTEFSNLASLQELTINDNLLKGSLPLSLTSMIELDTFRYNNTNLCAPTNSTFQTWLAGISLISGTWNCLVAPVKTSPVNNVFTKDTTPKFTWVKQMNGEKYQIMVDNNSDFSSPVFNITDLVNPYKTFTTALTQGAFYWRVRAKDPGGNWSPWSTKWKFSVDTTPPGKTTLLSPANGSKTSDSTPTFTWKAVTGAKYYQLIIDDNADFSSPVFTSAWMTGMSKTLGTALAPKLYYWRVKAKDAAGNLGAWSTAWKVTIK